jgi:diguanylate cyclase (GGDEF)-like protein
MGDQALKNVADIIKAAVNRNDFIARVGGEEFIVIGERENTQHAFETMKSIKEETNRFNGKETAPYKLSMSIGYAFIKNGERRTADEIIREADKRMYNEKDRIDKEF